MKANGEAAVLRVPLDKVWMIVAMAREALGNDEDDHQGNDDDDDDTEVGDALFDYVDALNGDELADLLALAWLGRGDFLPEEWREAQAAADEEIADGDGVAELLQDPLLPDDVTTGLEALGYNAPED